MSIKTTSLAFAAACLTVIATMPAGHAETRLLTNGPQVNRGDVSPNWSARQNVIESQQYDRLVASNPGFRSFRMRKECGPIADPEMRNNCVASFNTFEPGVGVGSSMPPRNYRSEYGR
jgi:hypothetical protein